MLEDDEDDIPFFDEGDDDANDGGVFFDEDYDDDEDYDEDYNEYDPEEETATMFPNDEDGDELEDYITDDDW